MRHLALLYYVVSFTTGSVSIGLCLLLYRQYRKPVLRWYEGFLAALALILASLIATLYGTLAGLTGSGRALEVAANVLDKAGAVLLVGTAPFLFHRLLAIPVTPADRVGFLGAAGAVLVLAVVLSLRETAILAFAAPLVLMYGMIAYCLVLVAANLRRLGDPTLRRVLRVFLIVSLVFFPLMLGEFLRGSLHLEMLSDVLELFSLPSYFLAINVLSIVLCFRTFSEPPYLSGQGLTEHFTGRFGITPREREIIPLLVEGRTYAEVADSLYISYKTVDNHVQNIYQKTGVRNRLQLAHLLQANQAP